MLKCSFIGKGSYTSMALGMVQESGVVVGTEEFVRQNVPSRFFDIERVTSWGVDYRLTLGDKLYLIPCLYNYKGNLGVDIRDESLFRVVSDKVRLLKKEDVCCVKASLPELVQFKFKKDISTIIAHTLETELVFNTPILETLSEEKEKAFDELPERYVVVCGSSNDIDRSWKSLPYYIKKNLNFDVIVVNERSPVLFPIIEGAELVVTVNTSTIPMAGGFQVPGIAVSSAGVTDILTEDTMGFRVKPFLEWDVLERVSHQRVLEAVQSFLKRKRLCCWCGGKSETRFVQNNLRLLKCSKCGTVRQDVKLSEKGLMEFYSSSMYDSWRVIVEKEISYSLRFKHDLKVSVLRLNQWGVLEGASWLDVGSGGGALVTLLHSRGWDSVGLECSKKSYPTTTWEEGGTYDVISFIDVLEHFMAPLEELKRALSHLSEKGHLVIELPNAFENPIHFRRLQHIFYFDAEVFEKLIARLHLKVVKKIKPIPGKLVYILRRDV